MELSSLLPDQDFDLKMRFTKGGIAAFFQSRETAPEILAERRQLLAETPETYSALFPGGEDLITETIQLALSQNTLSSPTTLADFQDLSPLEQCRRLGELWEADFLLMKPDEAGVFRLLAACVCFPSHWDLGEKMGLPMLAIHQPVPGLNEALGRQIDGFLHRIKPGISWERRNWGLSRSPEPNLHPSLNRPRLDSTVGLEEVWWRLEEQSLVALPESGGVLFGIKLVIKPLSEIKADPGARPGLIRALQTMSDEMAEYKGIQPARERILDLLSI